jgi:hypothetical protein
MHAQRLDAPMQKFELDERSSTGSLDAESSQSSKTQEGRQAKGVLLGHGTSIKYGGITVQGMVLQVEIMIVSWTYYRLFSSNFFSFSSFLL